MRTQQPRTVKEIAKKCGVSSATVSRVLTGKANPDLESTRKVSKVLKKYRYKRQRKTTASAKILAIMGYNNIEVSEHASNMNYALHEASSEMNIQFMTHFSSTVNQVQLEELIANSEADAVLVISSLLHFEQKFCSRPIVCLTQERFYDSSSFSVDSDDIAGFAEAMRYLISLGHKRIGFFCDYEYGERLHVQGTRAMIPLLYQACGLPTDLGLIWKKDFPSGGHAPVIAESVEYFCSLAQRPTALMILGDQYMPCFYSDFQSHGLVVGEDISLIGYSGSAAGEMVSPPVTTLRKDYRLLSIEALKMALELINNPELKPRRIMVPPKFIVRGSTTAAK